MQLRKGMIAFPTISDSSQLPLFKTILLDIQKSNVLNNNLDEDTMNLMINHLIKGDLLRAGIHTMVLQLILKDMMLEQYILLVCHQ